MLGVVGEISTVKAVIDAIRQIVQIAGQGESNRDKWNQIGSRIGMLMPQVERLHRESLADNREVFAQISSDLTEIKQILEDTKRCESCVRCPKLLQRVWDVIRAPFIVDKLDSAIARLDTLKTDVILKALDDVDRRIDRPAQNDPFLPKERLGFDRVQLVLNFIHEHGNGMKIRVVGIHGEGGLGKTTLLNETYAELKKEDINLERAYVVVGEHPERADEKFVTDLQSSIIEQLGGSKTRFSNVSIGKGALQEQLLRMKVSKTKLCLAIDNVWEETDLENLLPSNLSACLPSPSYILLTTRNINVVKKLDTLCAAGSTEGLGNGQLYEILQYSPKVLSGHESKELFVKHATKKIPLTDKNREMVDAIVPLCEGLPLALEVLGAHFADESNRGRKYWQEVVKRMKTPGKVPSSSQKILDRMQISYDRLKVSEQEAFLDATAFFYGWEWDIVERILGTEEMNELENRCLLKRCDYAMLNKAAFIPEPQCEVWHRTKPKKYVRTHDLLLSLGRLLAAESRVGDREIGVVNDYDSDGLKRIKGLWLKEGCKGLATEKLKSMRNLRILHVDNEAEGHDGSVLAPLQHLRYLRFRPHSLKQELTPEILAFSRTQKELHLINLQNISLSFSHAHFPTGLRVLHLHDCPNLVDLPDSFGQLEDLQVLHIHRCSELSSLPDSLGKLEQLQELVIIGRNRLTKLPSSLGNLGNLELLALEECTRLDSLPETLGQLESLRFLFLKGCSSLRSLPVGLKRIQELEQLNLSSCYLLEELPTGIDNLPKLRRLLLEECYLLRSLPPAIGDWESLEELRLTRCTALTNLPLARRPGYSSLTRLDVMECRNMLTMPGHDIFELSNLKTLKLGYADFPVKSLRKIGRLSRLEELTLAGIKCLETLPSEIGELKALKELDLWGCIGLKEVEMGALGTLTSLTTLNFSGCESLMWVPGEIGRLKLLRHLVLDKCVALRTLPATIGDAISLQELDLNECEGLEKVPASISRLRWLSKIDVKWCRSLVEVPEEVRSMRCFMDADLSGCDRLHKSRNHHPPPPFEPSVSSSSSSSSSSPLPPPPPGPSKDIFTDDVEVEREEEGQKYNVFFLPDFSLD